MNDYIFNETNPTTTLKCFTTITEMDFIIQLLKK